MKAKKLLLNALPLFVLWGAMAAYAAAPTGGYLPNATLDPDCAPWDTDCFVQIADDQTSAWDNADGTVADETGSINYTEGNVGIGTTTPSWILDLVWDGSAGPMVFLRNDVSNNSVMAFGQLPSSDWASIGQVDGNLSLSAWYDTATNPHITITNPGNVGIGTTAPGSKLSVLWNDARHTANFTADNNYGLILTSKYWNNSDSTRIAMESIRADGVSDYSSIGSLEGMLALSGSGNSSNNPHAVIDNAGNVGIGTTAPTRKLHVVWDSPIVELSAETGPSQLLVRTENAGWGAAAIQVRGDDDRSSTISLSVKNDLTKFWGMTAYGETFPSPASSAEDLSIYSNSGWTLNHVMRFSSNGNVGIGTTSPDAKLHVIGGTRLTTNAPSLTLSGKEFDVQGRSMQSFLSWWAASANFFWWGNNEIFYSFRNTSDVAVGSIALNGTTGVNYNTTSDKRLKENFRSLTNALATVNDIEVSNYNFIGSDVSMDGFIAQQLNEVLPYAVSGTETDVDEDGNMKPMSVDYSKVVPVLTAAIQELNQKHEEEMEAMREEIGALKAQIQ